MMLYQVLLQKKRVKEVYSVSTAVRNAVSRAKKIFPMNLNRFEVAIQKTCDILKFAE